MKRWKPEDLDSKRPTLVQVGDGAGPVAGLLVTCSAECFAPDLLTHELAPAAWLVHRTPGNVVPPYGAGYDVEEELIERAVHDLGVGTLVVCGHHPCGITAHLRSEGEPADDFVLRDWLSHAAAVRRVLRDAGGDACAAAAHNVLAQLANLRTHPAVAAALAGGRLQLWGWLYAGQLLYPSPGQTTFDRLVALHPEQNRYLRRQRVLESRPPSPCGAITPYLA